MIIGLMGLIGSGKNATATILVQKHGFTELSFADSLKDTLSVIFGWKRHLLEGKTEESRLFRETVDNWWSEKLDIKDFTPRFAMQHIGTNILRTHFNRNIWVAAVENKLRSITGNVVITDCRFHNEARMIKNCGGKLVRVVRGDKPSWWDQAKTLPEVPTTHGHLNIITLLTENDVHQSEWSSASIDEDFKINNVGTYGDLVSEIKMMIETFRSI